MEKKNIPELRFKGFEDEWEELPLSKYADFSKGRGYTKNDLRPIGNEIILYGMMYTDYKLAYTEIDTYAYKKNNSVISTGVEVIVPASGETAKEISIASAVLKKGVILGGDLNIIKPDDNIDPLFLAMSISHGEVKKELTKMAEGATISHLRNNNLKTINILAPLIKEQEKISKIFINLDKKLELEKEKHKKLKDFKKSMLKDMFPKEGESIPKLRFDGFEGNWINNKVKGLLSYEQPGNYIVASDKYKSSGIPVLTANKSFILGYTDENNIYNKGECIIFDDFTMDLKFVDFPFMVKSSAIKILTSISVDLYFMYILLSSLELEAESHKRHYISFIQELELLIPSLEEQEKIGNFFKNLDQKIEASEEKIKKIEDFKKSLMEKMFV